MPRLLPGCASLAGGARERDASVGLGWGKEVGFESNFLEGPFSVVVVVVVVVVVGITAWTVVRMELAQKLFLSLSPGNHKFSSSAY